MNKRNNIILFEWEYLHIGEKGFDESHFNQLSSWLDKQNFPFFELHHKKIRFLQWVGVIQIGKLSIEVLPKADKNRYGDGERDESIKIWQKLLPKMIRKVHGLNLRTTEQQNIKLTRQTLLDLYYSSFLKETHQLIHQGLIKKYRYSTKNRTALKGKLDISKHINKNIVHKENFFTRAQVYDRENNWNQILLDALRLVSNICPNGLIRSKAKNISLDFPDWPSRKYTDSDFTNLVYDRKTEGYRSAIELARLILMQYNPNMNSGKEHVLAFLFDMNRLWEGWLEYNLKKQFASESLITVYGQKSKKFWGNKTIRPDIVIEDNRNGKTTNIVLDAKWKVPTNNSPSSEDLKQMFVYNLYWDCTESWLVYPASNENTKRLGVFNQLKSNDPGRCGVRFEDIQNPRTDF